MCCTYDFEQALLDRNYKYICGVDEVGRGALFGPVVAGAVILNPQKLSHQIGINDSKQLSARKRLELAAYIYQNSLAYALGWCWNEEIDQLNILVATKKAMKMAIRGLQISPDYVLMDGMKPDFIDIAGTGIVKGDSKSMSIAAAAIIAKVFRDQLMVSFHSYFPRYGLAAHKGYPTRQHREAIGAYGTTCFHRQSFRVG